MTYLNQSQNFDSNISVCSECKGTIVQTNSDFVCKNCGLVQESQVLFQSEANFDQNEKVTFYEHNQMNPLFLYSDTFSNSKITFSTSYYKYLRLKKYSRYHINEKLKKSNDYLKKLISSLELPEKAYYDSSLLIKRAFHSINSLNKNNIEITVLACIYLSTRLDNIILPFNDLYKKAKSINTDIKKNLIMKRVYEIKEYFHLKYRHFQAIDYIPKVVSDLYLFSTDFQKICSQAEFERETINNLTILHENKIKTLNPYFMSIITAYFTSIKICKKHNEGKKLNLQEIAKKLNLSAITLHEIYSRELKLNKFSKQVE